MKRFWQTAVCILALCAASTAFAQSSGRPAYEPAEAPAEELDNTYEVTYQEDPVNARVSLGIGLMLPGFIGFQAGYQSFGAGLDALYIDARFTGSVAGESAFGNSSPLWQPSFETDIRIGYGSRTTGAYRANIKDEDNRRIRGRLPGVLGITPYLGWRGRWGYDMQAIRLGIHVERDINAEVRFGDGRLGESFRQWAFDFELFYTGGEQRGLGALTAYDQWFNDFVFARFEVGYAPVNDDRFAPERINDFTGAREINAFNGFMAKALFGFAFQFRIRSVDRQTGTGTSTEVRTIRQEQDSDRESAREQDDARDEERRGEDTRTTRQQEQDDTPRRAGECSRNADCDDGVFCNGEETCFGGICQPGSLPDDGISCTQLVCDEEGRTFRQEPLHGLCGDGQFCNGTERCDPQRGCVAGNPVPVDDNNPCTRDSCDEVNDRIINEPIPGCTP